MSTNEEKEFCFTWKIENFSFCCRGKNLESPVFEADSLKGYEWRLILIPHQILSGKEVTFCNMSKMSMRGENEEVWIDYKIEMMDSSGRVLKSAENKNESFASRFSNSKFNIEIDRNELDVENWIEDVLILRCHLKNADPKVQIKSEYCEARTKIGVDKHSFELELGKKRILEKKDIFNLTNAKFTVEVSKPESGGLYNLTIKIYKTGIQLEKQFMLCEITLVDSCIDDISEKVFHAFESEKCEEVWEFSPLITQCKLHNNSYDIYLFSVRFEFSVSNGVESNKISKIQSIESYPLIHFNLKNCNDFITLQSQLRELLKDKRHADVKLRAGSSIFPVHKSILIARSPVFAAMFEQDMIESQTGIVDVPDVDERSLNAFLEYVYTGIANVMDYDCAKNLLLVSDKYQVLTLREKCSSQLIGSISVTNVCEVLTIADMITDDKLKNLAFGYMSNNAEEVMQLPEWSQFVKNNSSLSIEVLSNIVLNLKKASKEVSK